MSICKDLDSEVFEDKNRLSTIKSTSISEDALFIVQALKKDQVILVEDVDPGEADSLITHIAKAFNLSESLEIQAGMASIHQRENVGNCFMTVDRRGDYQFVSPHSEGSSFMNMQLAAFYCYENSVDGGETILLNVDQSSKLWDVLREKAVRGKSRKPLTAGEITQKRMQFRLNMPEDTLTDEDEILTSTTIDPDFTVFDVLAKPKRTYSTVLEQEIYALWYTIQYSDYDSLEEFHRLLVNSNLLKQPQDNVDLAKFDDNYGLRIKRFGSQYSQLFKSKITYKTKPNDFLILNNLSWAHAANNWTPGSGVRNVVGAFA